MSWTLCSSAAAIKKAGANANTTIIADAATLALWSEETEGVVVARTDYDWVANYASLGTIAKGIVAETCSDLIGNKIIDYDMANYTSRIEAQTIIIKNDDEAQKNIATLKDANVRKKLGVNA